MHTNLIDNDLSNDSRNLGQKGEERDRGWARKRKARTETDEVSETRSVAAHWWLTDDGCGGCDDDVGGPTDATERADLWLAGWLAAAAAAGAATAVIVCLHYTHRIGWMNGRTARSRNRVKKDRVYLGNQHACIGQRMNGQVECENFEDRTDELADDGDSSPSPSEDTKYDFPLTEMSYDNDSDKPFICEHTNCNKRFANKFLLKKHQFIHTGLRPHTCPYCSKRFNRKDNLLRHKKTHLQTSVVEDRRSLPEAFSGLFPAFSSTMGLDLKMDGLDAIKIEPLDAFRVENNED
ncbi:unnamed protein product [Haemonchus placei]|uniref:C2H2-type domain-containing protein n=1 Tax=Haemonchus placei TaxID=6290 RepID=A0A158QQK5_HAEPC|nr:unnamed protein product [Haemonchus placei]